MNENWGIGSVKDRYGRPMAMRRFCCTGKAGTARTCGASACRAASASQSLNNESSGEATGVREHDTYIEDKKLRDLITVMLGRALGLIVKSWRTGEQGLKRTS